MSYILQALQRAEAERNRGATPGLHTPTLPAATAAEPRRGRALPWGLGAAALVVAGALAWWLWPAGPAHTPVAGTQPPSATAAAPQPAAPAVPATPAPAVPAAPTPATPPVAQAVPPTAVITAPPEAAPAPAPRAEPAPRRAPADAPPPRAPAPTAMPPAAMTPPLAGPAAAARPATQPAPVAPPVPASPANTAPAQAPLPTLAELPPALRQSLPALNLGGGIYSAEPANRLLIVNGQVLREKAQLAPELVLESIGPRAAVFRFRGQRFEMRY